MFHLDYQGVPIRLGLHNFAPDVRSFRPHRNRRCMLDNLSSAFAVSWPRTNKLFARDVPALTVCAE